MGNAGHAINEVRKIEEMAGQDQWLNRMHPLVKLCITFYYISITVSFHKYNLAGLLFMSLYVIILYILGGISFTDSLYRLRIVLPVVCITGILNPFFDHAPVAAFGGFVITGGMVSMLTLMIKGVFTVFSAYLLIASTPIQKICAALRLLHVPKLIVTVVLLIYRYVVLMLEDVERITQAYALRAPGQKGINFRAWGPLAGQLLLRSMDRAQNVYESMSLRGFQGEFYYGESLRMRRQDIVYLLVWLGVLPALRFLPMIL